MARGQILPEEGGRGSTCSPARLWSVSKSSSRFAETPPSWGMHLPGQQVRAAAGPRCCRGTRKGSLTWVLAGTCRRKGFSPWAPSLAGSSGRKPGKTIAASQEQGSVCWVVACGQRLPQVSDPSSLGVVQEGASAVAADRFEVASDLLLKRPCFLPPIHFFLAPWFPLSTQGLGVSCSLGTPRPPLPEVHQDRLCGVRIKDTCCARREEGEHGILQWRVPKLSRSV